MDHETILKFKDLFEAERERLLFSQAILNEDFHIQREDLLDETDLSSAELETTMRMRLRNRRALFLKKINQALRRIEEGEFGECTGCGGDIELGRLEARPTATLCASCKEQEEHREYLHIDGHQHKSLGRRLKLI